MALVPLLDKDTADESDHAALAAGESAYGQLLNTWRAIANRPGLFSVYLPFLRGVAGPGALDQRVKELTAIYVTILNHCRYSASHRCASGRAQGLTDDDLDALAAGDLGHFTEAERVALELAREMTLAPPQTSFADQPTAVSSQTLTRIAELFEPAALVELTMSISVWNALSRFHRVMGLELDMPAPPGAIDAVL
jgi:AhpD family alkylhydroperoxidase